MRSWSRSNNTVERLSRDIAQLIEDGDLDDDDRHRLHEAQVALTAYCNRQRLLLTDISPFVAAQWLDTAKQSVRYVQAKHQGSG